MRFLSLVIPALITVSTHSVWAAETPIIDLNAIDPSVNPCEDFYQYSCGNWLKTFQLPSDKSSYYRQGSSINDASEKSLNELLVKYSNGDLPSDPASRKDAKMLGDYYSSCMNTDQIDKDAGAFIAHEFNEINQIKSASDLASLTARLQLEGVNALFNAYSTIDMDHPEQVILQLDQAGTSLPERSYYFDPGKEKKDNRKKFLKYIAKIFSIRGDSSETARKKAHAIFAFETDLETKALSLEDQQDTTKLKHIHSIDTLKKLSPSFDWGTFFQTLGVNQVARMNVTDPAFFKHFSAILQKTPLSKLKLYLKWQVLNRYAPFMEKPYRDAQFAFWDQYLNGQEKPKERWKACTQQAESALRDLLAQVFVKSISNASEIKTSTEAMITQIESALQSDIQKIDWLDTATRKAAELKLSQVGQKVAYPDHWINYETLELGSNYIENDRANHLFANRRDIKKIGRPTDKTLWDMGAFEPNAYYDPGINQLVLPLGILIPPSLDLNASWGANFGAFGGGTIGHELTHGFDSDGSHYDGNGALKDWWSPAVRAKFDKKTQCLVDQADQYEALPGLKVQGKQTLGENIADQGGVKLGYYAFRKLVDGKAPAAPVGQFNERQQYWLAYAQSWCAIQKPEQVRVQISTDVHPPASFRVNMPLANRPEFQEDFACKTGARMAPKTRCDVW